LADHCTYDDVLKAAWFTWVIRRLISTCKTTYAWWLEHDSTSWTNHETFNKDTSAAATSWWTLSCK